MRKLFTFVVIFALFLTLSYTLAFSQIPVLKRHKDYEPKIPVRILKRISLPKGYHEGLFFDGKHIWVCNGKKGNIWLIDPLTDSVVSEVKPVGKFTEGIALADDGTFWVTDWLDKKLYRVKIEEGKMILEYDISLEPAHPAGIVWTKDKLYVITWTRSVTGTEYHLMQLDEEERMFRKMRIKRIHEPAHLAWDGKHLWITSWYTRLVYKVDVDTFSVLGSFKSPVSETTGIAWDGKHFWITGSHADLYQVEL